MICTSIFSINNTLKKEGARIKTNTLSIFILLATMWTRCAYSIEQSVEQNISPIKPHYNLDQILDESMRKQLNEEAENYKQKDEMDTFAVSIILMLSQLEYFNYVPSEAELIDAIKMYQADLKEPPTGLLTKSQIDQLFKRSNKIELDKILINDHNSIVEDQGNIVFVSGTLKILDEHEYIWNPLNITNIECLKPYKLCIMNQVSISDIFSTLMHSYSMTSVRTIFKITNWGENEINAVSDESLCRIEELKINTNDGTANIITSNKNIELKSCQDIGKLVKPQISQLVPGLKESQDYWDRKRKENSNYYSSKYKNNLKNLLQK